MTKEEAIKHINDLKLISPEILEYNPVFDRCEENGDIIKVYYKISKKDGTTGVAINQFTKQEIEHYYLIYKMTNGLPT